MLSFKVNINFCPLSVFIDHMFVFTESVFAYFTGSVFAKANWTACSFG